MAHYVTTALGRMVPLEDRDALHGDTILKVLHDYHMSPFNPKDLPLALSALCNATGLSAADVKSLCDALRAQGWLEVLPADTYRISRAGISFVRSAPGRLPFTGTIG